MVRILLMSLMLVGNSFFVEGEEHTKSAQIVVYPAKGTLLVEMSFGFELPSSDIGIEISGYTWDVFQAGMVSAALVQRLSSGNPTLSLSHGIKISPIRSLIASQEAGLNVLDFGKFLFDHLVERADFSWFVGKFDSIDLFAGSSVLFFPFPDYRGNYLSMSLIDGPFYLAGAGIWNLFALTTQVGFSIRTNF